MLTGKRRGRKPNLKNSRILSARDVVEAEINMDYDLRLDLVAKGITNRDAQVDHIIALRMFHTCK